MASRWSHVSLSSGKDLSERENHGERCIRWGMRDEGKSAAIQSSWDLLYTLRTWASFSPFASRSFSSSLLLPLPFFLFFLLLSSYDCRLKLFWDSQQVNVSKKNKEAKSKRIVAKYFVCLCVCDGGMRESTCVPRYPEEDLGCLPLLLSASLP